VSADRVLGNKHSQATSRFTYNHEHDVVDQRGGQQEQQYRERHGPGVQLLRGVRRSPAKLRVTTAADEEFRQYRQTFSLQIVQPG